MQSADHGAIDRELPCSSRLVRTEDKKDVWFATHEQGRQAAALQCSRRRRDDSKWSEKRSRSHYGQPGAGSVFDAAYCAIMERFRSIDSVVRNARRIITTYLSPNRADSRRSRAGAHHLRHRRTTTTTRRSNSDSPMAAGDGDGFLGAVTLHLDPRKLGQTRGSATTRCKWNTPFLHLPGAYLSVTITKSRKQAYAIR